jgi:hypothetical protein
MRMFDEYAATTAPRVRADRGGGPPRATPLIGVQALALQRLAGNRAVSGMLAVQRDACCAGCAEGGECADKAADQGQAVASEDQQAAAAP